MSITEFKGKNCTLNGDGDLHCQNLTLAEYCALTGLVVRQHFTTLISDTYGKTRVSSSIHRKKINKIVLHTTGNTASAANEALNLFNPEKNTSFHAVADGKEVVETVRFTDVAHHAGDKEVNMTSLGFELSHIDNHSGYQNFIKYVGFVLANLEDGPYSTSIHFHREFVDTSCGGFFYNRGLDIVTRDIRTYEMIARGYPAEFEDTKTPYPLPTNIKRGMIVEFTKNIYVYDASDTIVGQIVPGAFGGKLAYPILGLAANSMLMIHTESFGQSYVKISDAHQIFNAGTIKLTGDKVPVYSVDNYLQKVGELTPNVYGGLEYHVEFVRGNYIGVKTQAYGIVLINNIDIWHIYESSSTSSNSFSRISENGYRFYPNRTVNVRDYPSRTGNIVAQYYVGESFVYDSYVINDSHIWLSYVSGSGHRRYVAWRVYDGEKFGEIKPTDVVSELNQYINLKPMIEYPKYGYYELNVTPIYTNISGHLLPYELGGISYKIIEWINNTVVKVQTRDFGQVQLYVDSTRATITNSPTYKVYG